MEIKNIGYNINVVSIDTKLTSGTAAEVGTLDEFKKLVNAAENSGVARVNVNIGAADVSFMTFLNVDDTDEVSVGAVITTSDGPSVVSGSFYVSSEKFYAELTVTAIGSSAKSTKSSK